MADLTETVEIAAKAMYEEEFGLESINWEDESDILQRRYLARVTPAINALHAAGLLKENTDG